MSIVRESPGSCPICEAAHTACTAHRGPITVVQLPARDALTAEVDPVPLVAEIVQETLPVGQVTTGTYRRPGRPKPS